MLRKINTFFILAAINFGFSTHAMESSQDEKACVHENQEEKMPTRKEIIQAIWWGMALKTPETLYMLELIDILGEDITTFRSGTGMTFLMQAALFGNLPVIEYLVARGFDVNATNKSGTTALMYAAAEGHELIIQCLIEAGATPTHKSKYGETALSEAAKYNYRSCCELLTQARLDVSTASIYSTLYCLKKCTGNAFDGADLLVAERLYKANKSEIRAEIERIDTPKIKQQLLEEYF